MRSQAVEKEIASSVESYGLQTQLTDRNYKDVSTNSHQNPHSDTAFEYPMNLKNLSPSFCLKSNSCDASNTNCHCTSNNHPHSSKDKQISFGRQTKPFKPFKKPNQYENQYKHSSGNKKKSLILKKKRQPSDFRYGNYHQYYGYRNPGSLDSRMSCMKKEWFDSKDVLDIGCNAGHLTLSIAQYFLPDSVTGVDIDDELVKMAKRNVRHYIKHDALSDSDFPVSLALSYGPIAQSMDPKYRYFVGNFPFNVQFIQGNYILPSDELLEWQEPFFDTVLCLSLTKWVHLNWGDVGVKRLFHRAYAHLRAGGFFLLEAQAFQTYSKRKKITEEIFQNFKEIKFFPEMFNEYLLKEVGFKTCELVDTPAHSSKGFNRPIYLFIKGDDTGDEMKPKHVIYKSDSESSCNYSDVEQLSD